MSVYDAVTERIKELPPNTLSHGSILSFPDRGPWGNSRYRGNCSGHVYKRIFEHLRPRVFTDPMVGSGTSVEVAREMGIEAYGLDLHSGFNILKTSILETVDKPSDLRLAEQDKEDARQCSTLTPEQLLKKWVRILKEDKRAIFKATALASKACDFLREKAELNPRDSVATSGRRRRPSVRMTKGSSVSRQPPVSQHEVHYQTQYQRCMSEDRTYGEMAEAAAQPLLEPQISEQRLEEDEARE